VIVGSFEEGRRVIPIHRPSLGEKLFFFFSGIIVSIPITLFFDLFSDQLCVTLPLFYFELCSTVFFTPFIEEFAKAYPLFYRHGETQRSILTLGFLVGLGFGLAEFLLYIVLVDAPIYLRLPAVLFHASSTTITVYGIATNRAPRFYLLAVALHLLNNFFAVLGPIWFVGGVADLLIAYYLAWTLYKRTTEKFYEAEASGAK
jgi:RsiW-degrading membrane proteinase PrsW (M82 family)